MNRVINGAFMPTRGDFMKNARTLMAWIFSGLSAICHGAEELIISIEPLTTQFTSESVPFKVVFTNAGEAVFSVPKPSLGRNTTFRVFNNKGENLARSGMRARDVGGYGEEEKAEYASLKPHESWKTETYDLFSHVRPTFRIASGQTVQLVVAYSLEGKEYKASAALAIPAHDLEIKPEYIPKEKALNLAVDEIKKKPNFWSKIKNIEPDVQCINGSYRVVFSRQLPLGTTGGSLLASVKIDATTGRVLQVLGPDD